MALYLLVRKNLVLRLYSVISILPRDLEIFVLEHCIFNSGAGIGGFNGVYKGLKFVQADKLTGTVMRTQ